jgi:hypothetical protein
MHCTQFSHNVYHKAIIILYDGKGCLGELEQRVYNMFTISNDILGLAMSLPIENPNTKPLESPSFIVVEACPTCDFFYSCNDISCPLVVTHTIPSAWDYMWCDKKCLIHVCCICFKTSIILFGLWKMNMVVVL